MAVANRAKQMTDDIKMSKLEVTRLWRSRLHVISATNARLPVDLCMEYAAAARRTGMGLHVDTIAYVSSWYDGQMRQKGHRPSWDYRDCFLIDPDLV